MQVNEPLAVAPAFKNKTHKKRFFNRLRSFQVAGPRDKTGKLTYYTRIPRDYYITRISLKYAKKILDYLGECKSPQSGNNIRKALKLQCKKPVKQACRELHRQGKVCGAMKDSTWFYWVDNAVRE
ncbi:MAG TPA: hypothetical protein VN368_02895 [Candidatus Methylomirabilis sp.]|nr:hypothetical protein [Candidatus Methylomirabilis sp.]